MVSEYIGAVATPPIYYLKVLKVQSSTLGSVILRISPLIRITPWFTTSPASYNGATYCIMVRLDLHCTCADVVSSKSKIYLTLTILFCQCYDMHLNCTTTWPCTSLMVFVLPAHIIRWSHVATVSSRPNCQVVTLLPRLSSHRPVSLYPIFPIASSWPHMSPGLTTGQSGETVCGMSLDLEPCKT